MKQSPTTSIQTIPAGSSQLSSARRKVTDGKALKALEVQAGGRDGLARLLLFLPAGNAGGEKLLDLLEAGDARPLSALLRETGLSPAWLAKALAEARVELEREIARASAIESAPDIIEDLKMHALDRMRRCPNKCSRVDGMGPKTMVQLGTDKQVCPECEGRGETMQSSAHKPWAADKLLKIAALPEESKGPLVAVQTNVSVKGGSADFMEHLARAAHSAIKGAQRRGLEADRDAPIVEAEVVPSTPQE